jgi:hypothetical protein
MRHGELPSDFAAAIASAGIESHGEKMIFF